MISQASNYLGKKVRVFFDRPIGTKHPKYGFLYELNYGFIPNTVSPDGEELDAYYLSEKVPLKEAEGVCIAYAHREDDSDDKLIVVKEGESYSDQEIINLIHFQEKWFQVSIVRR